MAWKLWLLFKLLAIEVSQLINIGFALDKLKKKNKRLKTRTWTKDFMKLKKKIF